MMARERIAESCIISSEKENVMRKWLGNREWGMVGRVSAGIVLSISSRLWEYGGSC